MCNGCSHVTGSELLSDYISHAVPGPQRDEWFRYVASINNICDCVLCTFWAHTSWHQQATAHCQLCDNTGADSRIAAEYLNFLLQV